MTRENATTKARRYLGEGRVIVLVANRGMVRARVRGDGAVYRVEHTYGTWSCTCPHRGPGCSHLRAVRLVTAPEWP